MSSSDYNESSYMDTVQCDQPQSITFLRITTIIYVIIFLLGTIGNILVIIVIIKHREMRSSTNYFLINLSLADLLVLLICMPVGLSEIYLGAYFPFGRTMCYIIQLSDYIAPQASTLTLLSVAAERYFAICTPFKAQYMFTARRTLLVCVATWVISFATCIPFMHTVDYSECLSGDGVVKPSCSAFASSDFQTSYFIFVSVVFFAVPCVVLTGVYFVIGKTLRSHDILMASVNHQPSSRTSSGLTDQNDEGSSLWADFRSAKLLSCLPCNRKTSAGSALYFQMPSNSKRKLERYSSSNGSVIGDEASTDCEFIEITIHPQVSDKNSNTSDRSFRGSHDLPPIKEEEDEYLPTRNAFVSNHQSVQTIGSSPPSQRKYSVYRPAARSRSHGKLIMMLGTVVAVFFVCWLPFRVIALWMIFISEENYSNVNYDMLMFFVLFARILVYINSAINPLLYNLISSKFRSAFTSTFACQEMPNSKAAFSKAPSSSSFRQTLRSK